MRLRRTVPEPVPFRELAAGPAGLRKLTGPSALGSDSRRFARLLWRMTKLEWMARYQGSILGYAWTILGPLLLSIVLYLGFSRVLRFGGNIENYQMVLILNILLFTAFTDGVGRALNSMLARGNLIRQIEVPRLVLPLATVATAMITLCLNLVVVLGMALVLGVEPTLTWLLLPVVLLGLLALLVPAAVGLSVINARFRDVGQAWAAIARALFFVSAVIIPLENYPESWQGILRWNPLAPVFSQAREWVIDPSAPSWGEIVNGWDQIVYPLAVLGVLCIAAVWVFSSQVGRVAEDL